MSARDTAEIRFERRGGLAVAILDRPKALNALTHDMVRALSSQLAAWRDDPDVLAVLVKAVPGRAFCAGGDIRVTSELAARRGVAAAIPFFYDEYRLDWRVKRFPKPYIALIDGITMGGGVGISIHGSHRVATERTVLAMPETGIGFFPDVGATYLLSRLPDRIGTWMALTGARLGGADCSSTGLATHFVPQARLAELENALAGIGTAEDVGRTLDRLATVPAPVPLDDQRHHIAACFAYEQLVDIRSALANEGSGWGDAQLAALAGRSPFSLHVALAQLARGRELDFDACMRLEYRIVHRILEGPDFGEGVRALIIDKDQRPRWAHRDLDAVSSRDVEAVFVPLEGGDLPLDWDGDEQGG